MSRSPLAICGDKAYDTNAILSRCDALGVEAAIPSKSNRSCKRALDVQKYKRRNLVERLFQRLKQARRVCFRFDKKAHAFLSWIWLFAALDWL